MSKRVILSFIFVLMGMSAKADYTITTQKPFFNPQAAAFYNAQQQYDQQYNQTHNPQYNQSYYQNPYQYQQPYYNPYAYSPYAGYGNNLPTIVTSTTDAAATTSVPRQIARNVGRAMMYKMIRGY